MKQFNISLAYLVALIVMVISPFFLVEYLPLTRQKMYSSLSRTSKGAGDFYYLQREIFQSNDDIDVLFLGQSIVQTAIVPSIVEKAFAAHYQRPFVIRTFAHNWPGEDLLYTLMDDLLSRRKVRHVVINLAQTRTSGLHKGLYELWTRYEGQEHILDSFGFSQRLGYYAVRTFEAPRKLLSLMREDSAIPVKNDEFVKYNQIYGNLDVQEGYGGTDFVARTYEIPPIDAATSLYSNKNKEPYVFDDVIKNGAFFRKLISLLNSRGVKVIFLNVPSMGRDEKVAFDLSMKTGTPQAEFVGVSAQRLFARLNTEELKSLYYNSAHLNINGAYFFTQAILPGLLAAYEHQVLPKGH